MITDLQPRECDALLSLARYLGKNYNLRVHYDPQGRCQADENDIYVPMMTDANYQRYKSFLRGVLYHETGHVADSLIPLYKRLGEKGETIKFSFMNSLDDHRVNLFQSQRYRNARKEIDDMHSFSRTRMIDKMRDNEEFKTSLVTDPAKILWGVSVAICDMLDGEDTSYLPGEITEIAEQTRDILDEFLEKGIFKEKVKGTGVCLRYAVRLERRLKLILEKPPREQDRGALGNPETREDLFEEMKSTEPCDRLEVIREEIQEIVFNSLAKSVDEHMPHPLAMERDAVEVPDFIANAETQQAYEEIKSRVSRDIDSMKSKIMALLMARKRTHFIPDSESGEIDTAAIYSLRNGNTRVFEKRIIGSKIDTAVEILMDCSGSMGGGKVLGARDAGIACGETLEPLRVPFEITGYTTNHAGCCDINFDETEIAHYNRFEPLRHFVFKGFEENFGSVKYRLLAMDSHHNNSDPDSVMWAACRLARRRESRKILIVMSDGQPAMSQSCDIHLLRRGLVQVVRKIIRTGIEIYGIGIYTDAPKDYYPEWDIIEHGGRTISQAVYGCLSRKLMNGRGL